MPGTRVADADSKVESGSHGSHGINGCPSWGFDVKLQPWPWKRVLRRVSPAAGIAQAWGAADAELSLVQLCWSRQQAGLAAGPSPERRLPLIYVWGNHCFFSPPSSPLFLPQALQLPPAGTSACSAPNCPMGASFSGDTQGLKIVTIVHPIGPSICCLIYE